MFQEFPGFSRVFPMFPGVYRFFMEFPSSNTATFNAHHVSFSLAITGSLPWKDGVASFEVVIMEMDTLPLEVIAYMF